MVRHQAVRMHGALKLGGVLPQRLKVRPVIRLLEKARRAAVAPLDDMHSDIRDDQARSSRHIRETAKAAFRLTVPLNGDCHHLRLRRWHELIRVREGVRRAPLR
jgi:hypothetical protein